MFLNYQLCLFNLCFLLNLSTFIHSATEVLRPRGVPLSKKSFYDPGKDFQCLDGSAVIPFLLVNDDYCDCDDGSDEPGTNACSNGLFHCSNIGFIEKIIPSSRVNDGICDCCDSSDEYNSSAKCPSNCLELGEQMRLERERYLELLKQGNEIRQTYIETAKQRIEEAKKELENLKANLAEIEVEKTSKLETKNQAEDLEREALEKHRAKEDEIRKQREEEEAKIREVKEREHANQIFGLLDKNRDGIVTLDEMKADSRFDRDNDGAVSDEEAKFFTAGLDQLVLPTFYESAWPLVKPVLEIQSSTETNANDQKPEEPKESDDLASEYQSDNNEKDASLQEDDGLEHEEEEEESHPPPAVPPQSTDQQVSLEYDEATNQLVEAAKAARDEYNQALAKFDEVQNKIRELEVLLEVDFGPSSEYMALKNQCFELHENEYVYKLCPFESASQLSKTGGSETSLGRWGKWIGSEQNPYEKFLMEGGQQCWNGPARSVIVYVGCGNENQLIRATEPNRCEYAFDFKTPAACVLNQASVLESTEHTDHHHSEL